MDQGTWPCYMYIDPMECLGGHENAVQTQPLQGKDAYTWRFMHHDLRQGWGLYHALGLI